MQQARDHFAGRLMAAPEVKAFKIGTDYISIQYMDGTTISINAVHDKMLETSTLEFSVTEQDWDWERGAK